MRLRPESIGRTAVAVAFSVTLVAVATSPHDARANSGACGPRDASHASDNYHAAADLLPEPDRSRMHREGREITADFASRGTVYSTGYAEALIDNARRYDVDWSCEKSSFWLWPAPYSFSPTRAEAGATITVTGRRLTGATRVIVNDQEAAYRVNSDAELAVTVPTGPGDGKITLIGADLPPRAVGGFSLDEPTRPGAPSDVTATARDSGAIVTWKAPTDDGGRPVAGYTVRSTRGKSSTTVEGTSTRAVVSGLSNGTPYSFTVTAHNQIGTSPASAASNPVTPARSTDNARRAPDPVRSSATIDESPPALPGTSAESVEDVQCDPRGVGVQSTADCLPAVPAGGELRTLSGAGENHGNADEAVLNTRAAQDTSDLVDASGARRNWLATLMSGLAIALITLGAGVWVGRRRFKGD